VSRAAVRRSPAVLVPTLDLHGSGVLVCGSFAMPGPDGACPRGAAAFLATLEQYEGCPPEQLDHAPGDSEAWPRPLRDGPRDRL
jgi:hypothetical protein